MKPSKIFKITLILPSVLTGMCVCLELMSWLKYGNFIGNNDWQDYVGMWAFMVAAANVAMLPLYIVKLFSGANRKVSKVFKDSENFIYTRDLPTYSAAIAGVLYDFKADYEQEFVAGILDLIAKGYIIEKQKSLEVDLPKVRLAMLEEKFSKCEQFILGICETNATRIKSGLMFDFRDALEEDLYNLGFYKKQVWVDKIKKSFYAGLEDDNVAGMKSMSLISMMAIYAIVAILIFNWKVALGIVVVFASIIMFALRKTRLTKVGEEEKENMTKLKHFLERETSFENKEYEEKKLWDRYPAFAVALGVNKEMAKTIMTKLNIKD